MQGTLAGDLEESPGGHCPIPRIGLEHEELSLIRSLLQTFEFREFEKSWESWEFGET